jgi:RNA polymerase sigma factor (TIGR02999 family)
MMPYPAEAGKSVTKLLSEMQRGSETAAADLLAVIYPELRRIAARYMAAERVDHTLQATALANEAYIRLIGDSDHAWTNRNHFFAVAASAMRNILVDYARRHGSKKRGGDAHKISLEDVGVMVESDPTELIDLDSALVRLAEMHPRQSKIVEMRYFAGLTLDEIADVLGVDCRTVKRDWQVARTWLHAELARPLE